VSRELKIDDVCPPARTATHAVRASNGLALFVGHGVASRTYDFFQSDFVSAV
jgi:hypothetical protein